MPLSIATWNINSVRLRAPLVTRFLKRHRPDVLCLQETKCRDGEFPHRVFERLGYAHRAVRGQKGYHGVATVSRLPFASASPRDFCGKGDARHMAVTLDGGDGVGDLTIHNFYVPSGGDAPDPEANDKFAHKLAFLDEMADWLRGPTTAGAAVLVGDLNVAPLANDVWSHRQLLNVVSHTPAETERLEILRRAGNWTDAVRHFVPPEEKAFTWWSYRARDWRASNRGRRLDHIWVTGPLVPKLATAEIVTTVRGWARPSDHVPVIATLEPFPTG